MEAIPVNEVFKNVCQMLGPCLFTLQLNKQLGQYVSWRSDPFAMVTDALGGTERICLSPICFNKSVPVEDQNRELHSVDDNPCCRTQPWSPTLLELLVDFPILLPEHKNLLRDPYNQLYSQNTLWHAALKYSETLCFSRSFWASCRIVGHRLEQRYKHCLPVRIGTLVQLVAFKGN